MEIIHYRSAPVGARRLEEIPKVDDTLLAIIKGTGSFDYRTLKGILAEIYGSNVSNEDARRVRQHLVEFYGFRRKQKRIFYSPQRTDNWD
jgi:hypothetical protein